MKATEAKLLDFLKKSPQFVIPIYQRTYSWTQKECRQLWEDVVRTGANNSVSAHFVGSIVYIEHGLYHVSSQSQLLVIDGQQRLTTVTLLIAALAKALGETEPVDGFSPRKLRNYYLLNPEESGERHYKLLLSYTDKSSLTAIVGNSEQPKESSLRVTQNFALFESWIADLKGDLTAVCKGLAKLVVVDIALSRDQDNPQLIFESMNSTGRELSQADLIRNFILMGLESPSQKQLYEHYWRPMEQAFGQEAYGTHFDSFMRHYLTVKTSEIPKKDEVYEAFKEYARTPATIQAGMEALVKNLRDFAGYFGAMALGHEKEPALKLAFRDLRELKADVVYPLLLELYHDYANGSLPLADLIVAVRLVESYVFRRAVCEMPTNSLNKVFAAFGRALKKDNYLESIQAHFLTLTSYRGFPTNEEFKRDLQTRDLYTNSPRRSYWLRRMENHGRKERVPVDEYTVEHILPQNEDVSGAWQSALGPDWDRIRQTWLHTLGNLTLTGYNSEYSDRPFKEKRDMKGGFRESPLRLNAGLRLLDDWNEDTIKLRAGELSALALEVWPVPKLPADVLAAYQPKVTLGAYSIHDHPYLLASPIRELFEQFRKDVLALDASVREEFFKTCVAYKAETNFVDVVPQAKRLVVVLNISYADIEDTKGLCKDVSGIGHLGYGDFQVALTSIKGLPYVTGLVRQSLDRQMGYASEG
jgi:uncharacterized protein with ParB-like and HNH nuclease domain/predicted transport protein